MVDDAVTQIEGSPEEVPEQVPEQGPGRDDAPTTTAATRPWWKALLTDMRGAIPDASLGAGGGA
jgi:hypothetical protein